MAAPIPIPASGFRPLNRAQKFSASGSPGSVSTSSSNGSSSPGCGTPPLGTSYFGKSSLINSPKSSVVASQAPPSPTTAKRLLRIRKMSEMSRGPAVGGSITTIPTQPSDINIDWAKLVINQYRIKHYQPPLAQNAVLKRFCVNDCKKSSGDLSTTCRVSVDIQVDTDTFNYVFIAKLLPADDPCRVYVFESNVFEKEISIYFELLPCLRQFCQGTKLEKVLEHRIPECIYGSNNCDGAGVMVFECAEEKGFTHPVDPSGLSLEQVLCTVKFMAKFHAIGSALLITRGRLLTLRYPFISSNVYSSPQMQAGARLMFQIYTQFLESVSGEQKLHLKFSKYCNDDCAAKEMFTCLRRQVDSPFNTIIHGELWEKNMLFGDLENESGEFELQSLILDWKNAKIASATKDLAFLLLSSTTEKLRRECLDDILRTYHKIFTESLQTLGVNTDSCQGLSYEDFYADYAMSTKGAFLQSVCVLVQEMSFMGLKIVKDNESHHVENLTEYENRALNLINDEVLNKTHFID